MEQRGRRDDDRGAVSIEMVLIFPMVMLVTLLALQAAAYQHARTIALAAAQEGARAATPLGSTDTVGKAAAENFLGHTGDGLENPSVTLNRSDSNVIAVVTGRCPTILPGFSATITQSAARPIEQLTGGGESIDDPGLLPGESDDPFGGEAPPNAP